MGTVIIVAVAAVLLLLTVGVGLAASLGRQHVSEDYFLAGQSLPWYAVALSLAGLSLRIDLWLGLIGLTCTAGIAAGGLAWSGLIGVTALAWIFLPYFVRKRLFSPAELLQRRYSPAARGRSPCWQSSSSWRACWFPRSTRAVGCSPRLAWA